MQQRTDAGQRQSIFINYVTDAIKKKKKSYSSKQQFHAPLIKMDKMYALSLLSIKIKIESIIIGHRSST